MNVFQSYLESQLQDPEFKREYEALELEYVLKDSIITARNQMGLTQVQLSKLTGVTQSEISRIECGIANPSIKTLQKLAQGMNSQVKIEFVPNCNIA